MLPVHTFLDLAARKPEQFKIVFVLDKPSKSWKGESGFISSPILSKVLPGAAYADRIKIFVCMSSSWFDFMRWFLRLWLTIFYLFFWLGGPPGQVNAISGGKASFKDQGELKGLLADLGYTASQVSFSLCSYSRKLYSYIFLNFLGLQILIYLAFS